MRSMRVFDMFCGGGGGSLGAMLAGARIVAGAEIADYASSTFQVNFPGARLFQGDLRLLRPARVADSVGRIDLLLSSPECTNHTCAKGGQPRSEDSKETALQVIRYARELRPRWVVLENVVHMRLWRRYPELKMGLTELGYHIREQVLDASSFGVPQKRRRLFLIADLRRMPPEIASRVRVTKPASSVLDSPGKWASSPLFTPKRAQATLERAERAIAAVGRKSPFLLVYYGTDGGGGWQSLDLPLRTITTLDRFALVEPSPRGYMMRMLQPSELKRAMGFPPSYSFPNGPRREKIRILGNAVCPPVMQHIVSALSEEK